MKPCTLVLAVVGVAFLATAAGCRKNRSSATTVNQGPDIFATDQFPGAPVQDGNLADDRRAMSPSGEEATGDVEVAFNGDRGTALAVFFTSGLQMGEPDHLYATHFDGETWTPPVALGVADGRAVAPKFQDLPIITFLNTADHASEPARARDGDALILWTAVDFDQDGAGTPDGENGKLVASYFDVSARDDASNRHGFQVLATVLTVQDAAGEDLLTTAAVTDGWRGQASFDATGSVASQGDATTGLAAAWVQFEINDALAPVGQDIALWYATFDLAQGGDPSVPLAPGPSVRAPILGFGASDAGLGSEETQVGSVLWVYNQFLFFRVASDDEPGADVLGIDAEPTSLYGTSYGQPMGADDDVTIQWIRFDFAAGIVSPPQTLALLAPDSTDDVESNNDLLGFQTPSLYGADEGLAHLLVFNVLLAGDPDAVADFGSMTSDGRLLAFGIEPATNDLFGGVIFDPEDPTIFDSVMPLLVRTQLSRNGDYVWVAWREPDGAGAADDLALRASQGVTIRFGPDGLPPSPLPSLSAQFSVTATLSSDVDGFDVAWFVFQHGVSYVCGAQSDPDVLHVFFEHSDASSDVVFDARLEADLAVVPAPSLDVSLLHAFEEGTQPAGPSLAPSGFLATDAGYGGEALCVFQQDLDATAGLDLRLFARVTGGAPAVEIDSADPALQTPPQRLRLVGTPPGESVGTLDPVTGEESGRRAHAWTRVHVVFLESATSENSGNGFALRARAFLASEASPGAAPGDLFHPPVGAGPAQLSLPFVDPSVLEDPEVLGVSVAGDTAAVWFLELGHLYYQEYDDGARDEGSGWRETDGVPDPALVDDDDPAEIDSPSPSERLVFAPDAPCDSLHGAIAFWRKELDAGSGGKRLQVRVRAGE